MLVESDRNTYKHINYEQPQVEMPPGKDVRKVQMLGRSSLSVTLPKSWVRQHNLSSGSTVAVTVDPKGVLHIYPEGMEREREIKKISPFWAVKV